MNTTKLSSKEYFKTINYIYFALIFWQILFLAIAVYYYYNKSIISYDKDFNNLLSITTLIIITIGILIGQFIYSSRIKKIILINDLLVKTSMYRTQLIIRYAFLEAPSMFSIVGFALTGNFLFIAVVGIIIITFLLLKPTREKLIADLQLEQSDKEKIYDPMCIISEISNEK